MRIHPAPLLATCVAACLACGRGAPADRHDSAHPAEGYVLFSPLLATTTYLVDRSGRVVHTWESRFAPGASVYLLNDGRLLRPAREPDVPRFRGGGLGGRLQEFDWDGRLTWEWVIASSNRLQHHDI